MPRVVPPIDGKTNNLSASLIETTAGFTAGIVATLVVHPFDILKTRLQLETRKSQWGNSSRILRQIVRDEGSYGALYRGIGPNMVGNSISWALYFLWYGNLKDVIQSYRGQGTRLNSGDYFLASGTSGEQIHHGRVDPPSVNGPGILTAVCTNPIWVIKTRMLSSGRNAPGAYKSMSHGVKEIMRTEGPRGFWRGLIPSLFGISHGAVQFAAYEQLKNRRGSQRREIPGMSNELSNWDYLALSAVSKMFAGSITYPYQVLRVRLQTYDAERTYRGVLDAAGQIWKKEGLSGFYKGIELAQGHSLLSCLHLSSFIQKLNAPTRHCRVFADATLDRQAENALHASPQANERKLRDRSSSTELWWRNANSSRERHHISGPIDPFPKLTPGAEVFDAQITSESLSQILVWYVYYDVVEVPVKSSKWFEDLPSESMSGWIGLGMELKRTNSFPSKTLKLVCDEMGIDAAQVAARLVRLSDRISMLNSELDSKAEYETQLEKLKSDLSLIRSLRPTPQSQAERRKREIELCIRDYMRVVYLKVVNVGQFDSGPAITTEESHRRNDVRKRLNQVCHASRDPPPKDVYDQALEMLSRKTVTLHDKLVRAADDDERNDFRGNSSNGSERCRSRSHGVQPDQNNIRRRSAPDPNDLERVLNEMRAQCTRFAEDLRQFRLQQERTYEIRWAGSLDPSSDSSVLQLEAAYNADMDINNHENHLSVNGHGTSPFRHLGVFPSSFSKRLPKSRQLGIQRTAHDTTGAPYGTHINQSERGSPEWPRNQHEDDTLDNFPRQDHSYHSDKPSSQPMTCHRSAPGQKPFCLHHSMEPELANEAVRQQHDANIEIGNSKYRVPGQAWRSLNRVKPRISYISLADGSSLVSNLGASLEPEAASPSNQNRLPHSPTPAHDPSLFVTPPSSPIISMLNTTWSRIPSGWPLGSEAGPSRLDPPLLAMSSPASIHDSIRGPSRATMAGFSDITDPGELTAAEAIRYRTRRAMASMVDLNALPGQSFQFPERCRGTEADRDISQPSTRRSLPRPQWTPKAPQRRSFASHRFIPNGASTLAAFTQPYVDKRKKESAEVQQRMKKLSDEEKASLPEQYHHLLALDPATREIIYNTRLPRSVQAVYMAPLRREPQLGLAVCDLQMRSYSVRNLEFFADFAMRAAYYLGLPARGPIPLPRRTESWTVPRSNFIHKKSQENFRRITLRRMIQIQDGDPEVVQCWLGYLEKRVYYGIGMKANVWEFEELEVAKRMDAKADKATEALEEHWSNFGMRADAATEGNMKRILGDEAFSQRPRPMEDYIRDPIEIRRNKD
ncbi:hypothetical protein E2P81_ATG06844 [Venturia nashicola]|uniref:Small ribosomal subunit protein uS10m n=1 Tax=Venturia nashicola TaxID=86259 RepID=A0A4Z1PB64_9PEZI|nr:hypothetical protein E6O75_ATG07015 [Venturia nashicola]TLD30191.1 hypothetical protein E2P81_ATG06844 [Venturia nashicola]